VWLQPWADECAIDVAKSFPFVRPVDPDSVSCREAKRPTPDFTWHSSALLIRMTVELTISMSLSSGCILDAGVKAVLQL
jgi:hypothetical protein